MGAQSQLDHLDSHFLLDRQQTLQKCHPEGLLNKGMLLLYPTEKLASEAAAEQEHIDNRIRRDGMINEGSEIAGKRSQMMGFLGMSALILEWNYRFSEG